FRAVPPARRAHVRRRRLAQAPAPPSRAARGGHGASRQCTHSLLAATAVPVRARLAHSESSRTGCLYRCRKFCAEARADNAITGNVLRPCGTDLPFYRVRCKVTPSLGLLPVKQEE